MFADPVKALIEVDRTNGVIAILFEKAASGFALAKVDFINCTLNVMKHCYQRSGIKVLKVVPLDYQTYVLVYGERRLQDRENITQSVLIRQNLYD